MSPFPNILAASRLILEGFHAYRAEFNRITQRAVARFENRDWAGMQRDSKERLRVYKKKAMEIAMQMRRLLQENFNNRGLWVILKQAYAHEVAHLADTEIAESFFNSVCRKVFGGMGAEQEFMFVDGAIMRLDYESSAPIFEVYPLRGTPSQAIRAVLAQVRFQSPFEDLARDVQRISERLQQNLLQQQGEASEGQLEILKTMFFRNKAAYIVGRLRHGHEIRPFIIPLLHQEKGIFADTLILDTDTTSIIFSFTRSYFHVKVAIPAEMIRFLRSIMPLKSKSELYNSIGFGKHGKTELYRDFIQHLAQSEDKFDFAPGIKGMVMAVFTLPSYPIVFKLIKDHFDPPKITDRSLVKRKYRLVKHHDRVGRMADTHEFEHFVFAKSRFAPALLDELLHVAPSLVHVKGDKVIIDHLYTERRMTPLNIFMEAAPPNELDEVIDEYGNTIKQLAAVNIFPGDMLLKNFGVTRHRRVVFYDYDEIGFLTDYRFRVMPKTDDGSWFEVEKGDVFPEEFRHFLIGHKAMEAAFVEAHSDLFTVDFWQDMQERQRKGEFVDAYPYRRRLRFSNEG
ncbi:MAG: bifunctional isocitrate dehydrogenase kinase/phosphatase [Bacteroidota bacterium]